MAAHDPSAPPDERARAVVAALEAAGDPAVRADMGPRYGIHTERAFGIPMARMRALAKGLGTDHALAAELWATGVYEARMVAAMVDDPSVVTAAQMDAWCADFDNWAIVDTVCFSLFDRSPHAWAAVDRWASADEEFAKRAGFALLRSRVLHAA